MNEFKDFGIKVVSKSFVGDKIKMSKILNKKIAVIDFKIDGSKYTDKGNGKCLHLQIEIEGKKHVVFTGSTFLMETIEQIPKDKFPFTTIIEEIEDGRYVFT